MEEEKYRSSDNWSAADSGGSGASTAKCPKNSGICENSLTLLKPLSEHSTKSPDPPQIEIEISASD